MTPDVAALAERVKPAIVDLAKERGRDAFSLAVELMVAMSPDAFRKWVDDGFPRSE